MDADQRSIMVQIEEAKMNLRLIAERKAEFVLKSDIPLQLIKDERSLQERLQLLQERLVSWQSENITTDQSASNFALAELMTKARTLQIVGKIHEAVEIAHRIEAIDPHFPGLYRLKQDLLGEKSKFYIKYGQVDPKTLLHSDASSSQNLPISAWKVLPTFIIIVAITISILIILAWQLDWLSWFFS